MRWDEAAAAAGDLYDAEGFWENYDAAKRLAGASFEDSTADEWGEAAGLWEDKPAGYYAQPGDTYGGYGPDYYGGGYPPSYGADNMQTPIDIYPQPTGAPNSQIVVPGVGDVQVQVIPTANPNMPISAAQAAMAIVQLVLSQPGILAQIKSAIGGVIRRPPSAPGGGELNPFALKLILHQMDDDYLMPIAQFLAGLDTPIGLSKKQQQVFLALLIADGFDSLGIVPHTGDLFG